MIELSRALCERRKVNGVVEELDRLVNFEDVSDEGSRIGGESPTVGGSDQTAEAGVRESRLLDEAEGERQSG